MDCHRQYNNAATALIAIVIFVTSANVCSILIVRTLPRKIRPSVSRPKRVQMETISNCPSWGSCCTLAWCTYTLRHTPQFDTDRRRQVDMFQGSEVSALRWQSWRFQRGVGSYINLYGILATRPTTSKWAFYYENLWNQETNYFKQGYRFKDKNLYVTFQNRELKPSEFVAEHAIYFIEHAL